jgi:hypothetical protein
MTTVGAMTADYCGHCGGALSGAAGRDGSEGERPTSDAHSTLDAHPTPDAHQGCQQRLAMEPPRYCVQCRRRMKVQVTPLGWSAECSRHGLVSR